jgi:Ankyrin repeats (3 copies)
MTAMTSAMIAMVRVFTPTSFRSAGSATAPGVRWSTPSALGATVNAAYEMRRALLLAGAALAACVLMGCGDEASDRQDGLRDVDRRLLAAAYRNDVAAARDLIEAGADVDAKDDSEQSAYLIATSEVGDDPRLLELTLAAGADVDAKDSYDGTGLIRAAERGHSAIVERLLETGIDVDHVNRLGWTALLEAVVLGEGGRAHVRTARRLVNGGADVGIADEDGVTAHEHARRRGFTAIERILVAASE